MVDRIRNSSERNNADSWKHFAAQAEQLCRAGDDHTLRRIISNNRFEDFQPARKFSYVKGVVKDFPCVQKAQQLLRSCLHGYRLRPDAVDCTGTSIAHWAAQREHPLPLFKTLKELGSPLTKNNKAGMSPLHYLFWNNGPLKESNLREAARFLVATGCLIDLRDRTGESPFHVACLRKDPLTAFHVLHELGADLLMKTKKKETALHLVAASCDPLKMPAAFKFLLDSGADSSAKDCSHKTMLYYVLERKEVSQEIRTLIMKMVHPSQFDEIGITDTDSVVLSPQTSSGFSEKMSVDFSDDPGSPSLRESHQSQFLTPLLPVSPFSARYSPYEPRNTARILRQRSSTQCYPISTSNYHKSSTESDTASTSDLSSGSDCVNVSSRGSGYIPRSAMSSQHHHQQVLLSPSPPVSQWFSSSSSSSSSPVRPTSIAAAMVQDAPRPSHHLPSTDEMAMCACAPCKRQMLSKTEAEIARIRLGDVERENAELRRLLKRTQERLERHENCPICMTAYTISSRRTLKSCGHMLCENCAMKWLETESQQDIMEGDDEIDQIPLKEPVLCPVCRTPYDTNDLVKSLIS